MADQSDWLKLKQRCADNGCDLVLRVETNTDTHVSLAAIERVAPNKRLYDIRDSLGDSAPQSVITDAVAQASKEWWA